MHIIKRRPGGNRMKFLKRLITTLIILLVIFVVLPVALAFIFLFDASKMKVTYDENFDEQKWSKALVVDSLDDVSTTGYASFSVTEGDINNFIHNAIKDEEVINQYLSQLALDIQDDCYVLNVSGKAYMFQTKATLTAKLSKELIDGQEAYCFTFEKLTLGRITKLKEAVMFFMGQFLSDSTMDGLTEALNIHFDLANSRAYMYTSDLRAIINDAISGDSGKSEFYFTFISDFLDHNLVDIDFYGNEALSIRINFDKTRGNDYGNGVSYVDYSIPYENTTTTLTINGQVKKLSLDVIRDAIVSLLNNQIITIDNMHDVAQYLYSGYRAEDGGNAPSCDLSSIGISNKLTYKGFNLYPSFSMNDEISSSISSFGGYDPMLNSFTLFEINESMLNTYLATQSALGHKYFLQREVEENNNKVNYIAIDNAYFNLTDDNAVISIGLNVNGLETWTTLELEKDLTNTDSKKLIYDVSSIYFGSKSEQLFVSSGTEELINDTLSAAMSEGSFSFKDGKLTIGFDGLIDSAISSINTGNDAYDLAYRNFLQNNADYSIEVIGNQITDNSIIRIQANRRP